MKRLFIIVFFLSGFLPLFACKCCKDTLTANERLENAWVVFKGTATEENNNWMSGGKKYTFVVEESWKQQANRVMYVNTPFEHLCGMRFEVGKKYMVFAKKDKRKLVTDCCFGNFETNEEKIEFQALGKKMGVKTANPMSLMLGISATLLVVLGGFAFFLFSRRAKSSD